MKQKHKRTLYLLSLKILFVFVANTASQNSQVLEEYISLGLKNNTGLKQKEYALDKSIMSGKEATGLLFPQISFSAQYYLAEGGRKIEIPMGDLLNPVYDALNQISKNNGQQEKFPQVNNREIRMLPDDYYDSKIRIILQLINVELYFNRKFRKKMISYAEAEMNVYKRDLVKNIKIAYFRYLQATNMVEAYNTALELVAETCRVTEKMMDNHFVGREKAYRLAAEKSTIEAQLCKAENDRMEAAGNFNVLLNQNVEATIIIDSMLVNYRNDQINSVMSVEIESNEDFILLHNAIRISENLIRIKKASMLPTLVNITDFGYQGYSAKIDLNQQYVMNTIHLQWILFDGFQNRFRIKQMENDTKCLRKKLDEFERLMIFQEKSGRNNIVSAQYVRMSALAELESSKLYFNEITKQYDEGQKTLLELLDARNQLTSSRIKFLSAHYEVLIQLTEYERITARYKLP